MVVHFHFESLLPTSWCPVLQLLRSEGTVHRKTLAVPYCIYCCCSAAGEAAAAAVHGQLGRHAAGVAGINVIRIE